MTSAISKSYDLIIIGGGLTGSLISLFLASYRPEVRFLLIEASEHCGGEFLEPAVWGEIPEKAHPIIDGAIVREWDQCYSGCLPGSARYMTRIILVDPAQIHLEVVQRVRAQDIRLNCEVYRTDGGLVEHSSGVDTAESVIDARESATLQIMSMLIRSKNVVFDIEHGLDFPILADPSVSDNISGFQQYFPVDPRKILIRYIGGRAKSDRAEKSQHDELPLEMKMKMEINSNSINSQTKTSVISPGAIPSRLQFAAQLADSLVGSASFDKAVIAKIIQSVQSSTTARGEKLLDSLCSRRLIS